ncbi:hypothetical protein BLA39750_01045 [Burkholderia lata]|uniref:Uncharacterized protein n=1 Tax=Burkholderia lata (strain ATCC 17760 / DSM 23089 / LMG 22485 / NCIMB 9086 / R18194 / 383) TaxID=482957 RepID=A0A6P2UPC5_BURL3|nr:hypothetical protein [Burkholderia lata]VWC78804.1 hypothetical protein BLA39750_01045 [Burkholderia lata]
MGILMLPVIVLAVFAIGAGRCAVLTAPIATGVAIFHDSLFATVDVSRSPGRYPSPLALIAEMPWTLLAVLSWVTVLMWLLSRFIGVRSVLLEGLLVKE